MHAAAAPGTAALLTPEEQGFIARVWVMARFWGAALDEAQAALTREAFDRVCRCGHGASFTAAEWRSLNAAHDAMAALAKEEDGWPA